MGKIIIIRHGNRLDFLDPEWIQNLGEIAWTRDVTNSPLSECGIQQSMELANHLSVHFPNIRYVFSSPYLRTLQTAHPICTKVNIPIYLEYSAAEGGQDRTGRELPSTKNETYFQKFNIDASYQSVHIPEGEETYLDTHIRVMPFVKKLEELAKREDGVILVFTHAITAIALVRGLMRDPSLNVRVSTCSITEIEVLPEEGENRHEHHPSSLNGDEKKRKILRQLCSHDHLPNKGQFTWGIPPLSHDQEQIELHLPNYF